MLNRIIIVIFSIILIKATSASAQTLQIERTFSFLKTFKVNGWILNSPRKESNWQ